MDQRKAEILITVLKEGSFRKAADVLHCTQSAVTQSMDSLERELGCKVINRNYRGAQLTAAGERLYPFFLEYYNSSNRLMQEALRISEGKESPIRIGTFSSIANTWLPKLIREYQATNPGVQFDVQIGADAIAQWLLEDKIDIALGDELRCKVLKWTPLIEDHFSAIVPLDFFPLEQKSVTLDEMNLYPFVIAPLDRTEDYIDLMPKEFIRVKCENDSVIISMVSQGFGVSILPDSCLWTIPETIHKMELLPEHKRVIGMSISDKGNRRARQFAKYIKNQMQQRS